MKRVDTPPSAQSTTECDAYQMDPPILCPFIWPFRTPSCTPFALLVHPTRSTSLHTQPSSTEVGSDPGRPGRHGTRKWSPGETGRELPPIHGEWLEGHVHSTGMERWRMHATVVRWVNVATTWRRHGFHPLISTKSGESL